MAEQKKAKPLLVVILVLIIVAACVIIVRTTVKRPVAEKQYTGMSQKDIDYQNKKAELMTSWDQLSGEERTKRIEELNQMGSDSDKLRLTDELKQAGKIQM